MSVMDAARFVKEDEINNSPIKDIKGTEPKFNPINVLKDYDWTNTPSKARGGDEDYIVPYIKLEEYEITMSSLLMGIIYMSRVGLIGIEDAGNLVNQYADGDLEEAKKTLEATRNEVSFNEDRPYEGLYHGKPTGTTFKFPYLEEFNFQAINAWGSEGGAVQRVMGVVGQIIESTRKVINIMEPGTHVELPKFYQPSDGGNTYTFSFPLLNTLHPDQIQKNWDLCHTLVNINLPYKRSTSLLNPPSLFVVEIPGIRYSPASSMQSVKIRNMGNSRILEIDGQKRVIPDAYIVEIEMKDLMMNTKNIYATTKTSSERVNVFTQKALENVRLPILGGSKPTKTPPPSDT